MTTKISRWGLFLGVTALAYGLPAVAAPTSEIDELRAELRALKSSYEVRVRELESRLASIEKQPASTSVDEQRPAAAPDSRGRKSYSNSFNPSIGLILNGRYATFSESDSEISGFAIGEEGERSREGFSVDESELTFAADIDNQFRGGATVALVREDGEDIVELEEAFFQNQAGSYLPQGLVLKAGRAFWTFGYLNEHHPHADDFADRPLPYRAFVNGSFNDDGVQLSYVLPTSLYSEVGGGVFRGDDFPLGGAEGSAFKAWSGFARIGGDLGETQDWRLGFAVLGGDAESRSTDEDEVIFDGDSMLYNTEFRYTWAPTGNSHERELILQAEYLWRSDDGSYTLGAASEDQLNYDELSRGFYTQAVFKFRPQWRVGVRYSQMFAPAVSADFEGSILDSAGHDPRAYAVMVDWTNSEFSRFRLQLNREELSEGVDDNQLVLQYIMSLGAHAAHSY